MKRSINKKTLLYITLFILSIASIIFQSNYKKVTKLEENEVKENIIYITGCVKQEGLYTFGRTVRLNDVINAAGGLKDEADLEKINLARVVKDGEKINIQPKTEEKLESDYTDVYDDRINLNTATKEELMKLDGIGESTAEKILKYIEENGIYDITELLNIEGIGEHKFENLKEKICI